MSTKECYLLVRMSADKFTACVQNILLFPNARMLWVAHAMVNGYVDDVLFNAALNVQQTPSQFVNISNLCLVDTLLLCSPYFVIQRVKIWTVRWPLFRWNKVWRVSRRKSSIVSRARCAGALSCWNTNSFPDICLMTGNNFCVSSTSR